MEKIFQEVVKIVSEGSGINGNDLIHSKKEECVDARSILINLLSELGFTDTLISRYTCLTRQGVNKLKNTFNDRKRNSFILSTNYQQIRNELATNNLISNE